MPETKARFLADTQKADTTAEAFVMPTGRATTNNYVLAMTDISTGLTGWQVTATAPAITGVSGELNVYESGSTGEDGGVLTLTGTDFGSQSDIDSIKIMDSSEGNKVTASSFTVNSSTSITVTFNGGEVGYNSWGTGGLASTVWHIQVTKSGMSSNVFNSGKSFTKDPTISSVTQTASGDNNGTLIFNGTGGVWGSYGGQVAGGPQDSNTKLLLNFDRGGGTDVEDSSNTGGDGHKVTATSAVIKASPFGDGKSAMYFDGVDDVLNIGSTIDTAMTAIGNGDITIELWLNFQKDAAEQGVISFGSGGSNGYSLGFGIAGRTDQTEHSFDVNITGVGKNVNYPYVMGEWFHIALVKKSQKCKFYINGIARISDDGNYEWDNTGSFSGVTWSNRFVAKLDYNATDLMFGGYQDEIRISNNARYDSDFDVPTSRFVDDNNTLLLIHSNKSTNTAFDGTADANGEHPTITVTGTTHSIDHGGIAPAMPWPASGKLTGSAGVYLDGADDYLTIPDSADFGFSTGDYTIDFWLNCGTQSQSYPTLVASNASAWGSDAIALRLGPDNDGSGGDNESSDTQITLYHQPATTDRVVRSTTSVTDNTWHHVALSKLSGTIRLFIDGTVESTSTENVATDWSDSTNGFLIGRNGWNGTASGFKGYIDSLRIQNVGYSSFTVPTKIYGAYGPDNPSIGSIEITTATDDDVNVTYSFQGSTEDNADVLGTSSDLAIASDTTGANKKKGTLTGTLQGNVGSVMNLRIQAKANNDAKRLVEVNETTGVGAIRLDKVATGEPVLFNGRRYNGTSAVRDINGLGFKPDLIWIKQRSGNEPHSLFDSLRTEGHKLASNEDAASAEANYGKARPIADGFHLFKGTHSTLGHHLTNRDGYTYIGWCWKAGGAPVSISSGVTNATNVTQSASSTTGLSITKFTGHSSGVTFPHNLGGAPDVIWVKRLTTSTANWVCTHSSNGTDSGNPKYNYLNLNNNLDSGDAAAFPSGAFHASNISLGTGSSVGGTTSDYICYAWKEVSGVSAFGSYTGPQSSTVSCGFKPSLLIIKRISGDTGNWFMFDKFREETDLKDTYILSDTSGSENSSSNFTATLTSNGFTTGTADGVGASGSNYTYMAFA